MQNVMPHNFAIAQLVNNKFALTDTICSYSGYSVYYNMVVVAVAMVISTMHEKNA